MACLAKTACSPLSVGPDVVVVIADLHTPGGCYGTTHQPLAPVAGSLADADDVSNRALCGCREQASRRLPRCSATVVAGLCNHPCSACRCIDRPGTRSPGIMAVHQGISTPLCGGCSPFPDEHPRDAAGWLDAAVAQANQQPGSRILRAILCDGFPRFYHVAGERERRGEFLQHGHPGEGCL